jgi:hypothetical protein
VSISQTPVGPIIEGNKITLTCIIQGGNPVATITWSCERATQITPTGSPSTVDAISSIELVTSKNNNGQTCKCTGRHLLWTKWSRSIIRKKRYIHREHCNVLYIDAIFLWHCIKCKYS